MPQQVTTIRLLLCLAVLCNIGFWLSVRGNQSKWTNVPPPPPAKFAAAASLGDPALAYRMNAIMIQNFGDTGGKSTPLKNYDFTNLSRWFFVQDSLDRHSNFIPYLAAYYFSGSQEPKKIYPILDYLEMIGQRPDGEKWRFLAQAIFLARFRMENMERALSMAHKLAAVKNPDMPAWTRQMPAFVMTAKGEKKAAYDLMLEILKTSRDKMHPEEVYSMRIYICDQILTPAEAKKNPICTLDDE